MFFEGMLPPSSRWTKLVGTEIDVMRYNPKKKEPLKEKRYFWT